MRNSIFIKILAIFLCAASLLGVVGGAAGALVLAEGDLYNKTVEDVMADRVQTHASEFATQIAYRYADRVLGGCPEEISRYGSRNWLSQNYTNYGYSILDAEGNVLETLNQDLKNSTQTHSIPITGQYMHLVGIQTDAQAMEEAAQKRLDAYGDAATGSNGVTVPPEGITIHHVIFTGRDSEILYEANSDGNAGSSTYYYRDHLLDNGIVDSFANSYDHFSNHTGFLFCSRTGQLTYTSFLEEHEKTFETTVYGAVFHNGSQTFTFQAENPEGIGTLSNEGGRLLFTAFAPVQEAAAAEAIPAFPGTAEASADVADEAAAAEPAALEGAEATAETLEAEPAESSTEETAATQSEETEVTEETAEETAQETVVENTEETQKEPSSASADPEEYEKADEDEDTSNDSDTKIQQALQYQIFTEWMLAKGLITEDDISHEMIPEDLLYEYLVEYELIDPEQVPDPDALKEVLPEETLPEEPVAEEPLPEETVAEETVPVAEPVIINGKPLESYQVNQTEYFSASTGEHTTAKYVYLPMPELTVEVYVGPELMSDAAVYAALNVLRQFRGYLLPVIGVSLVLFILSGIYLCTAAGRKPGTETVRASGINRIPLDLYLFLGTFASAGAMALAGAGVPVLMSREFTLGCSLAAASGFVCCLFFTGFCFAFVAQAKTGGGMWWRNTLTVRFVFLFMRCAEKARIWLAQKGFPRFLCFIRKVWRIVWKALVRLYEAIEKFTSRIGAKLNRYFSLMPLTWQWVVSGMLLFCLILIACNTYSELLTLICLAAAIALIFYGCHCFGVLLESTRKMGKGNLDSKVEDKFMVGCFRDFANDLNDLGNVAAVAAQKQLKSERMKTELITNVSHDIKTPLTSIINYVDLLQKPHSEEQAEEYLEVLDRQSQRLKKLVDDLMDMSKASTGNMSVEITQVDMVEAVNQALGEFADKLDRAQLYPVFRHSEASVPIMADGKLVWRVLSNILSNAVKYAMPRTRIYLDLSHVRGQVILSLKNISREELNIDAEELMERFVRGDISRNTEGSGLGLNIAKSLMELQKGQLQILVDGDLFKVTLIFPDAK